MKPNDKTAPRARRKVKNTMGDDFFKYLFEKAPILQYKYGKKEIKKIILNFNEELGKEIINNRYGVELPIINSQIFLAAYKTNSKNGKHKLQHIDYYDNKDIIRNNERTNGNKLKIVYARTPFKATLRFFKLFYFTPYRTLRLNASSYFLENWNNCVVLDKSRTKIPKEKETQDLTNYNELEI